MYSNPPKHTVSPQPNVKPKTGRHPLPAGTTLAQGAYTVGKPIGAGGFSITYYATETNIRLPLAIKEFFPKGCIRQSKEVVPDGKWNQRLYQQALRNFLEEAQALERFVQPGIVKIYSIFQENNTAYIAMEYLQGQSLAKFLKDKGGKIPEQLAIQIITLAGQALEAVHLAGLLHGDIKPENLLLHDDGRVMLLDFGASKKYLSNQGTYSGPITLTPGYAPPEQHSKTQRLGPYTDIYALAATLYHMLSGRVPPSAPQRSQNAAPLIPLHKLAPVSPRTSRVVQQSLALEPTQRPQSIHDFIGLLLGEGANYISKRITFHRLQRTGKLLCRFEGHTNWITSLDFHPTGLHLASGSTDSTVMTWDVKKEKPLGQATMPGPVNQIRYSPDGSVLAVGLQTGHLILLDASTGHIIATLRRRPPAVHSLAFTPNSEFLIAGLSDGSLRVYRQPGTIIKKIRVHEGPINGLSCSACGRILASGGNDMNLVLSLMDNPDTRRTLTGHTKLIQCVDFANKGYLLASGSNDMMIHLWDAKEGRKVRTLKGHSAMVWNVRFTPDPNILVSCSGDRTARVWRIDTSREFIRLEGHKSWIRGLACSPTDKIVATGGGDKSIILWTW